MIGRVKHTAHVMLINNYYDTPMVYLIQEKNKNWGIFGGGQETHDQRSLVKTAARELQEETLGSLLAHLPMFRFLDTYSLKDNNGGMHKSFIAINSRISSKHIMLDQPGNPVVKSNGDILRGQYVPLYLLLSNVYKKQYSIFYNGEQLNLRYFFAEAVRRNQDYLYTIFNKKYIMHTEARNNDLDLLAVTSASAKPKIIKPRSELIVPYQQQKPYTVGTNNTDSPYNANRNMQQQQPQPRQQVSKFHAVQRYAAAPYGMSEEEMEDFGGFESE